MEGVATLTVGTRVNSPLALEGITTILARNRWRRAWLVALAQVTHPQALTRLD